MRPCGNPRCFISTGNCEPPTFGSGKLDDNGYWEFPCWICARHHEAKDIAAGWREKWPERFPYWPTKVDFALFHENDPEAPRDNHRWHWVYLHGAAEDHMDKVQQENDWEWAAPDLFVCDKPMPTEAGRYVAELYGKKVVVVLAKPPRYACLGGLCGRAGFPDDGNNFQHVCTPEEWC